MSERVEIAENAGAVRRLYAWIMQHAAGRYRWLVLGAVSFAESSFFPLPPDVILVPMVVADRRRAWLLALWCTCASVVGGMFGYAIGALLYNSVGQWLMHLYGYGDKVDQFRALYAANGAWVILIKGLTPIPYKLVTIVSGFAGYNFGLFVLFSSITRGLRFGLEAAALYWFGEPAREFIEKRLEYVFYAVLIFIVLGFVIARYVV